MVTSAGASAPPCVARTRWSWPTRRLRPSRRGFARSPPIASRRAPGCGGGSVASRRPRRPAPVPVRRLATREQEESVPIPVGLNLGPDPALIDTIRPLVADHLVDAVEWDLDSPWVVGARERASPGWFERLLD